MMGQGIAYSSAMVGIQVVLKDISLEAAEKGKAYTETLLQKRVDKGRMTPEKMAEVLSLFIQQHQTKISMAVISSSRLCSRT